MTMKQMTVLGRTDTAGTGKGFFKNICVQYSNLKDLIVTYLFKFVLK